MFSLIKLIEEEADAISAAAAPKEKKTVSDFWNEATQKTNYYSTAVFAAKADGSYVQIWELHDQNKTPYGRMLLADFTKTFVLVNPSQQADIEGYKHYKRSATIQAITYSGDDISSTGGGTDSKVVTLHHGDFITKESLNGKDKFSIWPAAVFNQKFAKA